MIRLSRDRASRLPLAITRFYLATGLWLGMVCACVPSSWGNDNPLRESSVKTAVTQQHNEAVAPAEPAAFPAVRADQEISLASYQDHLSTKEHHHHEGVMAQYVPGQLTLGGGQVEVIEEGEIIDGGVVHHGSDCLGCSDGCLVPCPGRWLERVELFAGVQGFTGPVNRGSTGSFGFYEGLNWGNRVACVPWEISSQMGARWTQSNLSGAAFSDEVRNQVFLTGGFFRRADWGWQGGIVVDYLKDDWYLENELVQVRGELSWMNPCGNEFGFLFTTNVQDSQTVSLANRVTTVEEWTTTDLYAFFYRKQFEDCGASGRLFVGFSGQSDALIGAEADVPLSDRWGLRTGFTYLIPEESSPGIGYMEESWNVAAGLVFYPGSRTARTPDYNRPLFNVADNGSMLIDRK